jgi:hypothetical protein
MGGTICSLAFLPQTESAGLDKGTILRYGIQLTIPGNVKEPL